MGGARLSYQQQLQALSPVGSPDPSRFNALPLMEAPKDTHTLPAPPGYSEARNFTRGRLPGRPLQETPQQFLPTPFPVEIQAHSAACFYHQPLPPGLWIQLLGHAHSSLDGGFQHCSPALVKLEGRPAVPFGDSAFPHFPPGIHAA